MLRSGLSRARSEAVKCLTRAGSISVFTVAQQLALQNPSLPASRCVPARQLRPRRVDGGTQQVARCATIHSAGRSCLCASYKTTLSLTHAEERKKLIEAGEKQAQALREAAPRQINPTRLLPAATALTPGAHFWAVPCHESYPRITRIVAYRRSTSTGSPAADVALIAPRARSALFARPHCKSSTLEHA